MQNASVEFNVATLSPTYKLLIGIPGKSNAFHIAQKLGLSEDIIGNARDRMQTEELKLEDMLADLHEKQRQADEALRDAKLYREQTERMRKTYEDRLERLTKNREDMLADAKKEAVALLEDARREARSLVAEARKAGLAVKESDSAAEKKIKKYRDDVAPDFFKKQAPADAVPPKVGDDVDLINLGQKGVVLSINGTKDALVQVGILKVTVPLTELKKSGQKQEQKQKQKSFQRDKSATITTKLDLRGCYLDEALAKVEKYLDDAYLSNLSRVEIIHGRGTGVLRDGVRKYLKNHPYVVSYRFGAHNEGGDGVTVVELKET